MGRRKRRRWPFEFKLSPETEALCSLFVRPLPPIPEHQSGEDPTNGRRRLCVSECKSVDADVRALDLLGTWEGEPGPQTVGLGGEICQLVPARTPLGGYRWWWICPKCGARRKKLYLPFWVYASCGCRVCYGLSYRSSQKNRRPSKRMAKLMTKLGVPGYENDEIDRVLDLIGRLNRARDRRLAYRWNRARAKTEVQRILEADV